ncbi:MAG: carboxypeptidase regulatory-like domain-containing protein [Planctomycetes bacterium]|nr:carboxypeptidase regulatory-like domain-containing protein [Planctomycetota bacterium]
MLAVAGAAAVCAVGLIWIRSCGRFEDTSPVAPEADRRVVERAGSGGGEGPDAPPPAAASQDPRPAPPARPETARPARPSKRSRPAIASLQGIVRDLDGPRPGARVVLYEFLGAGGPAEPGGAPYREIARTIAIEDGSFRFERVARVEEAFLVAISPERAAAIAGPFALDADASAGSWDLVVGSGRSIEGIAVSRDRHRAIGGARIRAACRRPLGDGKDVPAYIETREVWSFEGGSFAIEGFPEGAVELVAEAPGFARTRMSLASDGRTTGIRIVLAPGASISGIVRDAAGRAVANALVAATVAETRERYETRTRDDGTFDVESLSPGDEAVVEASARPGGTARLGPLRAPAEGIEIRLR